MTSVATIVEGDGEVAALPVLLRRFSAWLTPLAQAPRILTPIKVPRDKLLRRPDELSRYLQLAALKCGECGLILILLDADDECPAILGAELRNRAHALVPHRTVAVVLANREFEAWFIASAPSLEGYRGFSVGAQPVPPAEIPRDAKGWMKQRMASRSYGPTTDQPAFAARLDLEMARSNSRSFRKLADEWLRYVSGTEQPVA